MIRLAAGVFDEDVIPQALIVGRVPRIDQDAGVHDRHPLLPVAVQLVQEGLLRHRRPLLRCNTQQNASERPESLACAAFACNLAYTQGPWSPSLLGRRAVKLRHQKTAPALCLGLI